MNNGLGLLIFIIVWFVIMRIVLPRLGVPT
jgi:p-aminobenzoyl-glutamate transporter AbgT